MADEKKPKRFTADEILRSCIIQHEALWGTWQRERQLTSFYNSAEIPQDDDECGDDAPVSLGVGYRYLARPLQQLLDVIVTKPGFVKTEVCYPLVAKRQFMVSAACDTEINQIVQPRMQSIMTSLCGRAMITGRGFLFRLSRWDWKFRSGRLICPLDAPDDILDEGFREWSFTGKMTLRELDERIAGTRETDGFFGWSHSSLEDLKRYIIKTTFAEKTATPQYIDTLVAAPFEAGRLNDVLDVYWHFRKNGLRNDEGHEKVDLYCISRWGCTANIRTADTSEGTYKALDIAMNENQRTIYYLPSAFESARECLLPMLLDARIDGEQQMAQIDGMGKIMLPRLQAMEHLTFSLLEGLAFMIQPNWQYSTAVDANTIKMFQKAGLNPWDAVPAGMTIMAKNQGVTGASSVLQMLQMLGVSAEADAQTGEMSPLGESQAKFKAEAEQMLTQIDAGMTRRKERSMVCLDELADLIVETLSRPLNLWKKGDAGYYDAKQFQVQMLMQHKVVPAEYSPERMKATCRRLAGNMEKSQAAAKAFQVTQTFGGQMSPEALRFLGKEALRASYDESVADMAFPDEVKPDLDQVARARLQNSAALVDLVIPQREAQDDPNLHLPIHIPALEARFRLAQQAGSITPFDREGMAALLVHCSQDARAVPVQMQKQIGQILQQMATALQQIPLMGAQTELSLKEQKMQLEGAKFGFSQQREVNLVADRDRKAAMKQQDFLLKVQNFLEVQKNNGVTRAAQLLDLMEPQDSTQSSAPQKETASA